MPAPRKPRPKKPAPPRLPPVSEREFKDQILEAAMRLGWRCVHFRPARTAHGWRTAIQGHKGFPDVILCRRGVLVIAELKTDKGGYGEGQAEWLSALGAAHPHVFTWRPRDWAAIEKLLKEGP